MEQTESCQRGMRRRDWVKVEGLAKEYICITHRYRQQCGNGQSEEGQGLGRGRGGQHGGKIGASVIVSTIKINNKKEEQFFP